MSTELKYTFTNESLRAIKAGLEINSEDHVLAVGGSADQAFALLECAGKVTVIDIDPAQVEYIKQRALWLAQGDYTNFLGYGGSLAVCDRQSIDKLPERNEFFLSPSRLPRIRSKLSKLEILSEGDIFDPEIIEGKNKIYLSNARTSSDKSGKILLTPLGRMLPIGGLIYTVEGIEEKRYPLPPIPLEHHGLVRDERLTRVAEALEGKSSMWVPEVYKRIITAFC